MALVDGSGRPIEHSTEHPAPEKNGQNGTATEVPQVRSESKNFDDVDLRTVPSGTLDYNLTVFTVQEMLTHNDIQVLEARRVMERKVQPDQRAEQLKQHFALIQQKRYELVAEKNRRTREQDLAYCARHNVELYTGETFEESDDDEAEEADE